MHAVALDNASFDIDNRLLFVLYMVGGSKQVRNDKNVHFHLSYSCVLSKFRIFFAKDGLFRRFQRCGKATGIPAKGGDMDATFLYPF